VIRVAFIAGTYQPERCGVAHYTARLREVLDELDVESTVLTTHAAAADSNDPTVKGVVQDWQLTDLLPLVQAVHRTGADLLHIQHAAGTYGFERSIFLLPLLLRISGWHRPIVTTVHEYGWWEWQPWRVPSWLVEALKHSGQRRGWWDREDGFLLTLSDALITTNSAAEDVIRARLPDRVNRLHRIPIGANVEMTAIDSDLARQWLRQTCGWSSNTTVITFFGFLHPAKGIETLLAAFKQVLAVHPQARLLLVGGVESLALPGEEGTHYWHKLQALIAELELTDKVHLSGYLSAALASQYLAGADLGVLPFNAGVTLKSGSLLALLAHGLPVVATCHEPPEPELANPSLIQFVRPRQVNELAIALNKLLADPAGRTQLSISGCAFAHQFTWSRIAQRHLDVYKAVLRLDPPG